MKKGFTLIELLAVVVIIAIIATIGIYSVTKIMNQSRLNSLKDTAFAVKKTASLYANSNPDMAFPQTIDLTPGCSGDNCHSELMDITKDPWGKSYQSITAVVDKINNKLVITVYLETEYKDYYLANDSDGLNELVFAPQSVVIPTNSLLSANFKIEYSLPGVYTPTAHSINFVGGTIITASDYTIVNDGTTLNENGKYEIELNITKAGSYQVQLEITDGAQTATSNTYDIDVYSPNLPSTLYFNGDYSLSETKSGTTYVSIYNETSGTCNPFYVSIKVSRISGIDGSTTVISDWQQARVTIPYVDFDAPGYYASATYTFPGWNNGNMGDKLVVELGKSASSTGTPTYGTRTFTSAALNKINVNSHTWTLYYLVQYGAWDFCESSLRFGSTPNTRIVATPIS